MHVAREEQPLLPDLPHRLACDSGAQEGLKEQADGLLDLLVGIEDDMAASVVDQPLRQNRLPLPAPRTAPC